MYTIRIPTFYERLILVVITSSYYCRPPKNPVSPPGCMIYIQIFPNIGKGWTIAMTAAINIAMTTAKNAVFNWVIF